MSNSKIDNLQDALNAAKLQRDEALRRIEDVRAQAAEEFRKAEELWDRSAVRTRNTFAFFFFILGSVATYTLVRVFGV